MSLLSPTSLYDNSDGGCCWGGGPRNESMSMDESELKYVNSEIVGLAGEPGVLSLSDGEEGNSAQVCSLLEDAVSCEELPLSQNVNIQSVC